MSFRLLPCLIVIAVLGLTLRLGDVVLRMTNPAWAEVSQPLPAPPDRELLGLDLAIGDSGDEGPRDPFEMTDEELDLLQSLAARREHLAERERKVDERGALLSATELRVERRIEELAALKQEIEALLTSYDAQSDSRVKRLVKIYANMKAKDAARIFANLEVPVLLRVIRAMPERDSADFLAEMDPEQARWITVQMVDAKAFSLRGER